MLQLRSVLWILAGVPKARPLVLHAIYSAPPQIKKGITSIISQILTPGKFWSQLTRGEVSCAKPNRESVAAIWAEPNRGSAALTVPSRGVLARIAAIWTKSNRESAACSSLGLRENLQKPEFRSSFKLVIYKMRAKFRSLQFRSLQFGQSPIAKA